MKKPAKLNNFENFKVYLNFKVPFKVIEVDYSHWIRFCPSVRPLVSPLVRVKILNFFKLFSEVLFEHVVIQI